MRRYLAVLACVLATVVVAATSAAAEGGYNNLIQLDNANSAQPAVLTGSMVSHDTTNDAVQNANLAYSHSYSCTGCRTITVAVQAVIIEANPPTITPQNAAVAVNENCTNCQTFAYAHQYVFSPHHPIRISSRTNDQLRAIQAAIDREARSGHDFGTMSGNLDNLSWGYCYAVQQAVQSDQEGEHPGASPGPTVCGAAPFDHRQVTTHQ